MSRQSVEKQNTKESASIASAKMTISEAHRKLGHIAHSVVKHAISNRFITGIELDQNLSFVMPVLKQNLIASCSRRNQKPELRILVNECTGICGDQCLLKA